MQGEGQAPHACLPLGLVLSLPLTQHFTKAHLALKRYMAQRHVFALQLYSLAIHDDKASVAPPRPRKSPPLTSTIFSSLASCCVSSLASIMKRPNAAKPCAAQQNPASVTPASTRLVATLAHAYPDVDGKGGGGQRDAEGGGRVREAGERDRGREGGYSVSVWRGSKRRRGLRVLQIF
jgi:hypothetical protein